MSNIYISWIFLFISYSFLGYIWTTLSEFHEKAKQNTRIGKGRKKKKNNFFRSTLCFFPLSLSLHVLSKGKKQRLVSVHCLFIYLIIGWVRLDLKSTQTQKRPDFLAWTQPEHPSNLPNTIRVVLGWRGGWVGRVYAHLAYG